MHENDCDLQEKHFKLQNRRQRANLNQSEILLTKSKGSFSIYSDCEGISISWACKNYTYMMEKNSAYVKPKLFLQYLLAYLVFTFPSKRPLSIHSWFYRELKAYNFKGQKFSAKMWAKSSYYQIWSPQSTNYRGKCYLF